MWGSVPLSRHTYTAAGSMDTPAQYRVLIVTDSRGKTLEKFFPDDMLRYIDIRPYNGLTLNLLNNQLPKWSYIGGADIIYFMVGINDFTVLDHSSHTVRLVTPFVSDLLDRLKTELYNLVQTMKKHFPHIPYIVCPIYGVDIA